MALNIFPPLPGLAWSVGKKPVFKTRIQNAGSGRERRLSDQPAPIWEFTLTYDFLRDKWDNRLTPSLPIDPNGFDELRTLMGFFEQQQGRYLPFLFLDPTDRVQGALAVGAGDGTTTQFATALGLAAQLGGAPLDPNNPPQGVAQISVNGATVGSYTFDPESGLLTFAAPPPAGSVITADTGYWYRCRFSDDTANFENFLYRLWRLKELSFVSLLAKETVAVVTTPAPPPQPPPAPPGAALAYEAFSGGWATNAAAVDNVHDLLGNTIAGLSVNQAGDFVVAIVAAVMAPTPSSQVPPPPPPAPRVLGISDPLGLVWTRRARVAGVIYQQPIASDPGFSHDTSIALEEWWAILPSAQSGFAATAQLSGTAYAATIDLLAFSGVTGFDPSGTLPATAVIANAAARETVSVSDGPSIALAVLAHPAGATLPPAFNAPWLPAASDGYPGRMGILVAYAPLAAPQSALAVDPWGIAYNSATPDGALILADAVI